MIFVEDALTAVLKAGARLGMIPGLSEENIQTEETSANEWNGSDKVFTARGSSEPIYDVTSPTGHSGLSITEVAVVTLTGNRLDAETLCRDVWKTLRWKLDDRNRSVSLRSWLAPMVISGTDYLNVAGGDMLSVSSLSGDGHIDGCDRIETHRFDTLEKINSGDGIVFLGEEEYLHIEDGDSLAVSVMRNLHPVTGAGILVSAAVFGYLADSVMYLTDDLGFGDWIETGFNIVPRTDGESYRDEWFGTRTLKTVHCI